MALSINTNVSAISAHRNLSASSARAQSSIAKLSSGSRIVTAKDDAASLAIASGLRLDLSALNAAKANVSQGLSVLQVADGGFAQITDVLARMKTLASTAQSGQISATERGFLDTEYQELLAEIDRIADSTEFNGVELLGGAATLESNAVGTDIETADGFVAWGFDPNIRANGDSVDILYNATTHVFTLTVTNGGNEVGSQSIDLDDLSGNPFDIGGTNSLANGTTYDLKFDSIGVDITLNDVFAANVAIADGNNDVTIQTGTSTAAASLDFLVGVNSTDKISITLQVGTAAALGVGGTSVDTEANAVTASAAIDAAVNTVNDARATIGSALSRLEFAGANVSVQIENTEAAKSVLIDVDVAAEFTNFTSQQVLIQAGVSILAQANQQPQTLLRLLQ